MLQSLIKWDHSIEWAVASFAGKVILEIFNLSVEHVKLSNLRELGGKQLTII